MNFALICLCFKKYPATSINSYFYKMTLQKNIKKILTKHSHHFLCTLHSLMKFSMQSCMVLVFEAAAVLYHQMLNHSLEFNLSFRFIQLLWWFKVTSLWYFVESEHKTQKASNSFREMALRLKYEAVALVFFHHVCCIICIISTKFTEIVFSPSTLKQSYIVVFCYIALGGRSFLSWL